MNDDSPAPSPEPPVDSPPDHPGVEWNEELYQAASVALLESPQAASARASIGCLVVSAVLFVAAFALSGDWSFLVVLVPVLLFHEAGHFLGMRLFGYRNVQMFFIPFFGAAVSGSKHAAPVWQQAIVLLLGPLPGIILGLILQLALRPAIDSWQEMTVMCLVLLNASNLLPVVPLDGGRLLDILLFARKPYLTVAFRVFAIVALGWMGWQSGSWILLVVAGLMLIGTPLRYRQAKLERAFRNNPLELPDQLELLSDAQRRDLFGWATLLKPIDRTPTTLAADMRTLHENMVSRRPGLLTWMLLIGIYLAGFALSAATLMLAMDEKKSQREHQAQELVEDFYITVADLGEWRKQQAAAKDHATKDHLQERIDGRWKEQLTAWEKKSREVRQLALSKLIVRGKADPRHVPDILRLNEEVNRQRAAPEAK